MFTINHGISFISVQHNVFYRSVFQTQKENHLVSFGVDNCRITKLKHKKTTKFIMKNINRFKHEMEHEFYEKNMKGAMRMKRTNGNAFLELRRNGRNIVQ